jgi:hypothetical protein
MHHGRPAARQRRACVVISAMDVRLFASIGEQIEDDARALFSPTVIS